MAAARRGGGRVPPRTSRPASPGWLLALVAALAGGGCATAGPPVSKIVGGKVIVTRSIDPTAYEHVARADLYEEEERYEDAILELKRALTFDSEAPELQAHIAELALKLGKIDDAAGAVKDSLALGETVDGLIAEAHLRQRRSDLTGAVASLRKAAALTSFSENADEAQDAYLELADAQLESLDIEGAHATLRALCDGLPASASARLRLAGVAWALGATDEVETRLREALAAEPNHIEALLTLAWLYTADNRLDDARARFAEALERSEGQLDVATADARFLILSGHPDDAAQVADDVGSAAGDDDSLFDRIALERAAHRPQRALTLARARLSVEPKVEETEARLTMVIGEILADDDPSAAIQSFLRVPRTAARFAESRLRAAEVLRTEDKLNEAQRLLSEAESSAPTEALADEIAIAEAQLEEKAAAKTGALTAPLARLDKALVDRPGQARLMLAKAALLERHDRWKEALTVSETVLVDDPANPEALNFWGFVAAEHGQDLARALQRIRAAVAFDPGSGAVLDSLGWAHLQTGDVARATKFLEEAGRLEPEDPEILGHLAALYARLGKRERAAQALRKALAGKPEGSLRQKLQQQLDRLERDKGAAG